MATLTAAVKEAASTTTTQLYYILAEPASHASHIVKTPNKM
jgi:hypothetical protein